MISRRSFVQVSLLGGAVMRSCARSPANPTSGGGARLITRPRPPGRQLPQGVHELPASVGSRGALFVPATYDPEHGARLFIMLHGAGASRDQMHVFFPTAEEFGMVMLTPQSVGRTWDLVLGGFGPDVAVLDRALDYVFDNLPIDPSGITLGGFSDGGSYALSLGLANGDLFSRLVGFSPGFMTPPERTGKPAIFLAHGTRDTILPIDATSRLIERQLREWQYELTYREFDGPHTVTREIALQAFAWMKA